MAYLTPRKRAAGLGAAHAGTERHWRITVTSVALVVLTPLFVFTFGSVLGGTHAEVVAAMGRPWAAIVVGLAFLVGLVHFRLGSQVMIEDYAGGLVRKALIVLMVGVTYLILAVGLLGVLRLAI